LGSTFIKQPSDSITNLPDESKTATTFRFSSAAEPAWPIAVRVAHVGQWQHGRLYRRD
jgi:hypothetical protein